MYDFSTPWKDLETVRFSNAFSGWRKNKLRTNGSTQDLQLFKSQLKNKTFCGQKNLEFIFARKDNVDNHWIKRKSTLVIPNFDVVLTYVLENNSVDLRRKGKVK